MTIESIPSLITSAIISQPYSHWVEGMISKASEKYRQGRYDEGISLMGLVIFEEAKRKGFKSDFKYLEFLIGRKTLSPQIEKYLKAYLPLPQKYLKIIIEQLPAEIKSLSEDEQISFILMALAIVHQESCFNPEELSRSGAIGIMQILPETAEFISGESFIPDEWLRDPEFNIKIGLKYLYKLFCLTDGRFNFVNKSIALAGYNGGHGYALNLMKKANRGGAKFFKRLESNVQSSDFRNLVLAKYKLYKRFYANQVRKALQQEQDFQKFLRAVGY